MLTTRDKDKVFQAVLNASSLEEACDVLRITPERVNESSIIYPRDALERYILAQGVIHPKGERWKVSIQDFLDAGEPRQLELFEVEEVTIHTLEK